MRGVMGAPKKNSILLLVFECADRCREGRCPHSPLLWLAAGGKFAKALSPCGFCREVRSDPLVDPLLHTTHF